jgi:hypothetical protein
MVTRTPLPAAPTNADLAIGIAEVHRCMDEHKVAQALAMERLEDKLDTATRLLTMGQETLMTALGVQARQAGDAPPVRTVATLTPFQMAWRSALAMMSVLGMWSMCIKASGPVWDFLVNMSRTLAEHP